MAKIVIPDGLKDKELFKFLIENKSALIAEKKFEIKKADAVSAPILFINPKGEIVKASTDGDTAGSINRDLVINTTNYLDTHDDVHIPGLWKKSLSENKQLYLLQEHSMTFKGIITDEIKASTKTMPWKALGYNAKGNTEALLFNVDIPADRNPYMFAEYKAGRVKNHSVGMRYVIITLAINDEEYKEEFAEWNKYIDQIVNSDVAEDQGFFFAVKEAKVVEGSAVPVGSNPITPTLNNKAKSSTDKDEPDNSTLNNQPQSIDVSSIIKTTKFFN